MIELHAIPASQGLQDIELAVVSQDVAERKICGQRPLQQGCARYPAFLQELMSFPGGDKAVQSGLMVGASDVKDRPAIVDLPLGAGQVLMFATNPVYRWQNFGEYRMLWNALFSYKTLRDGLGGPPTIPDPDAKKDDEKKDADEKAE